MTLRVPPVDVFVVREIQGEEQHELIDQAVRFSTAYLSRETVCFRLTFAIIGGEFNKTVIYLQITPDHLDSLDLAICKLKNASPPHLDNVRRRLGRKGGRGDLTNLRFQVRNDIHTQLIRIVPDDFPDYEALDDPARHALDLVASVAASPSFSLYLPANQLSKQLLDACVEAVGRSSVLTEKELHSYQRAVLLQRLYGGKGGKVLAVGDCERISQPETDSCATTVGFDVVPRLQGSPPQYGECSAEVANPREILADAAHFVKSFPIDCAPPEYSDLEQPRDTPVTSKRVRECGDEDGVPHPRYKRALSRDSHATISTTTSTTNARRLEAKPRPGLLENADVDDNLLLRNLIRRVDQQESQQLRQEQENRQLRNQIKRLQEEVEQLRGQNASLEKRHSEVEDSCDVLEHEHHLFKDELENLEVHIDDVEGSCDDLQKQMPNILDEVEDLVKGAVLDTVQEDEVQACISDLVKEHVHDLFVEYMDGEGEDDSAEPLRAYIHKSITDQIATMKAKVREALRG